MENFTDSAEFCKSLSVGKACARRHTHMFGAIGALKSEKGAAFAADVDYAQEGRAAQ